MKTVNIKALLWIAPVAGIISAFINASLFGLYNTMGLKMNALLGPDGESIGYPAVMISSFLPSLIGAAFLALLGNLVQNPWRLFTIIAAGVLLLSFGNPLMINGIRFSQIVALNSLHCVVGIVLLLMAHRFAKH